ncbi:tyrosine-type recombinase/integrase [Acetohalobium arabaticum]|uniref:Integrase family protein n=1 Tax=Acetohalobium arabaticum (strain ATCC 49924 / DSM 5501 / Z-7288) TaxID=574087 RepID=D9QQA2_ACEAZ|nr:tyrosine-type recombinase/integrase [Acetohalobium arabaticum]ADL12693.1 integrase family protein [Acetohalobium arabaticum DSM 5501]
MYIYRLYNKDKEIIYIGRTKLERIELRIRTHFSNYKKYNLDSFWRKNIRYYDYAKVNNNYELAMYEIFYINKYNPCNNKENKFNCPLTVELPELSFSNTKHVEKAGVDLEYYLDIYSEWLGKLQSKSQAITFQDKKEIIQKVDQYLPKNINKLFQTIKTEQKTNWIRNSLAIKLISYTGLRTSELIDLDYKDIDLSKRALIFTRNNETHLMPINKELIPTLERHIQNNIESQNKPLFVSTRGNRMNHRSLQMVIAKYRSIIEDKLNFKLTANNLRQLFIKTLLTITDNFDLIKSICGIGKNRINEIKLNHKVL